MESFNNDIEEGNTDTAGDSDPAEGQYRPRDLPDIHTDVDFANRYRLKSVKRRKGGRRIML